MKTTTRTPEEQKARKKETMVLWYERNRENIKEQIHGFAKCEDCRECEKIDCRHNHNTKMNAIEGTQTA